MKSLGDSLKKTIAHKHLGNQMIGAVALNAVNSFLHSEIELEGHVRFKTLFLKVTDQALKIKIFQEKNQILHHVHLALEAVGYDSRIEEIRIKN